MIQRTPSLHRSILLNDHCLDRCHSSALSEKINVGQLMIESAPNQVQKSAGDGLGVDLIDCDENRRQLRQAQTADDAMTDCVQDSLTLRPAVADALNPLLDLHLCVYFDFRSLSAPKHCCHK